MTAFLATVMALSGLAAIESLLHGMRGLSVDFLLLTVFACVAAPHTLNLGHNARISILQPFMLAAIVMSGVKEAMALTFVAMVYFWLVGRPRVPVYKGLFNLCNFVLSVWFGGHVYALAGGHRNDVTSPSSVLGLLAAVLAFFAVNTGLVSAVVGMEQRLSPFRVWYEKYSWTLNTQLAGGSLVILLGLLRGRYGPMVLFLLIPFCLLTFHFYKAYFPKAAHSAHRT